MNPARTLAKLLANCVKSILDSEAVIQERGRLIRESVQAKSGSDWRLRGKTAEELDVIAGQENLRDTRTLEDISDQNWQHTRAQTFALHLLTLQMDELLGILRPPLRKESHVRTNDAEADAGRWSVELGNQRRMPPAPVQTSPSVVPALDACMEPRCNGSCGLAVWDSPDVGDAGARAFRRALHAVNQAGNSDRHSGWAAADRNGRNHP